MILDEFVEMRLNQRNMRYYEDKGYKIPKHIDKNNNLVGIVGETIMVNVKDLPPKSNLNINVECDVCHLPKVLSFANYQKSINILGFYACSKCKGKKLSIIIKNYSDEKKKEIFEKMQETYKANHGNYPFSQAPDSLDKKEHTLCDKYSVNHQMKAECIREKVNQTNLKKYGATRAIGLPEYREKAKVTNLLRYGVEYASKSQYIKDKIRNTNMIRYGIPTSLVSEETMVNNVIRRFENGGCPSSIQQRYVCCLYDGILNYPLVYYNLDIALPSEKLDVEYDGGGHMLSVKLGTETEQEFFYRTIYRRVRLKKEGWHIMRIISLKDNLPSDAILLEMLNFARQFFADNPERSWIEFDIDNNIYRNALHKDGEPYDFGPLRKIKQEDLETKALS